MREIAVGVGVAVLTTLALTLGEEFLDLFTDPPQPSGSVAVVHTVHDQTLGMFRGQARKADDEAYGLTLEIRRVGHDVETNGCRLRWSYVDVSVPAPVDDPALVARPARDVDPDPRSCVTMTQMWVPFTDALDGYERVAIKVELLAGPHVLGSAMSEPVSVS